MVSDCKTFAHKGCKIAAQKITFFSANFALIAGFFGIGATIRIDQEMLCFPHAEFLSYLFNLFTDIWIFNELLYIHKWKHQIWNALTWKLFIEYSADCGLHQRNCFHNCEWWMKTYIYRKHIHIIHADAMEWKCIYIF